MLNLNPRNQITFYSPALLTLGTGQEVLGGGVGRSREGVGHEVLSLVQGVGRAIFSYP